MSKLPLRPLVWVNNKSKTPFTEYEIVPYSDKWRVEYFNFNEGEPKKAALGHASYDDAKQWAQDNFEIKMRPWVLSLDEIKKELTQ